MKYILDEDTEFEKILELSYEDIEFIKIYNYFFKFDLSGTNEDVITTLKIMFDAVEVGGDSSNNPHGFNLFSNILGEATNNPAFVNFAMWYLEWKSLTNTGISSRCSWCYQGKYSKNCRNYEFAGYILIDYFRKNTVEKILDMIEVDACDLNIRDYPIESLKEMSDEEQDILLFS